MKVDDGDRVVALRVQLAQAHDELRTQLRELIAGRGEPAALREHCLAFCSALTTHHQGEDATIFPYLLRRRPDLGGTIAKLAEDHTMIAAIVSRVAEVAGKPEADAELPGLMAIMESHFAFEERTVAQMLN
jgi:iron-sulfur cluster repair protein YtfE (RIC family)